MQSAFAAKPEHNLCQRTQRMHARVCVAGADWSAVEAVSVPRRGGTQALLRPGRPEALCEDRGGSVRVFHASDHALVPVRATAALEVGITGLYCSFPSLFSLLFIFGFSFILLPCCTAG